jgi:hypothetical protein
VTTGWVAKSYGADVAQVAEQASTVTRQVWPVPTPIATAVWEHAMETSRSSVALWWTRNRHVPLNPLHVPGGVS